MSEIVCPCADVIKLTKEVEVHSKKIYENETLFAVLNTKMNLVLGILSCVGAALMGVVVKLLF